MGAGMILSGTLAFSRDRTWSSEFSFVSLQSGRSVGGLSSLAGQFGLNLNSLTGGSRPPEFFVAAVLTRDVLLPVIADSITVGGRRTSVLDFFEIDGQTIAIRLERGLMKFRNEVLTVGVVDRQSSIVRVTIRTSSADASHEIAVMLHSALNEFIVQSRRGQASVERRYARERLDSAAATLSSAEDRLAAFANRNRDLSASASLELQRDRLQREVAMTQQLFSALSQQYEEARLREYLDTPEVSVVERPFRPPLPNSRMAGVILVVGALAGFVLGVLATLLRDAWTTGRDDDGLTALVAEWRMLRGRASRVHREFR